MPPPPPEPVSPEGNPYDRRELMKRFSGNMRRALEKQGFQKNDALKELVDKLCRDAGTSPPAIVGTYKKELDGTENAINGLCYSSFKKSDQAIVISERALAELTPEELPAMLGHEIGHRKHNFSNALFAKAMYIALKLRLPLPLNAIIGWRTRRHEAKSDRESARLTSSRATAKFQMRLHDGIDHNAELEKSLNYLREASWVVRMLPRFAQRGLANFCRTHPHVHERFGDASPKDLKEIELELQQERLARTTASQTRDPLESRTVTRVAAPTQDGERDQPVGATRARTTERTSSPVQAPPSTDEGHSGPGRRERRSHRRTPTGLDR